MSSRDKIWAASWQNQHNDCAPSGDSDQPGHPSSQIRVFAVCMKKPWDISYPLSAQRRLWSDLADTQADLSLRWAHSHFVGFVMRRLIFIKMLSTSCCNEYAALAHMCLASPKKDLDPDQTPQNTASDQGLHSLEFLSKMKWKNTPDTPLMKNWLFQSIRMA